MPVDLPLDLLTRDKHLVYMSTAKLEGFLLGKQKTVRTGLNVGLSAQVAGTAGALRDKTPRELLDEAGRQLQDHEMVRYETGARVGEYLLLRAICVAGTTWPAFGDREERWKRVAFWIGGSEHYRLLAYGSRKHLLGGSATDEGGATWCPSDAGMYVELLESIVHAASLDQDLPVLEERSLKVNQLLDGYFNPGVRRGSYIAPSAVYELLVRVDGVEPSANELPTLYGSPVWVARVPWAVAGTYAIGPSPEDGLQPVADWTGEHWQAQRWRDTRAPLRRVSSAPELPPLPDDEPSPADILILGLAESTAEARLTKGPLHRLFGRRRAREPRD